MVSQHPPPPPPRAAQAGVGPSMLALGLLATSAHSTVINSQQLVSSVRLITHAFPEKGADLKEGYYQGLMPVGTPFVSLGPFL